MRSGSTIAMHYRRRMLLGTLVGLAFLLAVALAAGTELARSIFVFALVLVGLPLGIVCFIDLTADLQSRPHEWWGARVAAVAASVPVLMLGLVSIALGLAIIAWVLYNQLIERQSEFTGGSALFPLGIGPALVAVGWHWLGIGRAGTPPVRSSEGHPARDRAGEPRR